jgi:hypothetical protein
MFLDSEVGKHPGYSMSIEGRSRDSSVGIATGYGLDDQGGWDFESR